MDVPQIVHQTSVNLENRESLNKGHLAPLLHPVALPALPQLGGIVSGETKREFMDLGRHQRREGGSEVPSQR